MRSRHCRVCGDWHNTDAPWPSVCASHFTPRGPRSALAGPMIIRDGMEPIQSMADGQHYDSKSAYYRSVKEAGCEIVGNDPSARDVGPREYAPEGVGEDIKRAIEELS